ncbi:mercuric reductase [Deinococcus arenicola]|uniref:Mercuric reductase n=1 Tax=Deinococcus arenicola TaxID=2994950 RepID=A0ABU4DP27_9DEIO|nr:mercuric reductase [Deinococcus sp. ZS9-10]MDV6374186.1 mercuric reductase [Deinococcus sp. ZS9-10]
MNKADSDPRTLETFDAIIIGSGQAGTPLASELARAGWRVAIAEREHWGGTCVNEGCTPTKLMVACAENAHRARRAGDYGVSVGTVRVDLAEIRRLKRELVASFSGGSESGLRKAGVTLLRGEASFTGPHSLVVRGEDFERHLTAPHIFINTGGRPRRPDIPGLDAVPHLLNSTSIMELDEVPAQLVVIGGGYIGLEFAQMFARFGSHVTVLHHGAQLVDREDADIAASLLDALRAEGLTVHLEMSDLSVEASEAGATLNFQTPAGAQSVDTAHVLLATGRTPNTDALNLAAAGLDTDKRGYIPVDENLKTGVEGIWALGDVKGGPAFTHVSYDDYRIVRDALLHGKTRPTSSRTSTYTLFTDPQLGRIGLSEREAREQGLDILVATLPMTSVARAIEMQRTAGMMKAVMDRNTGQILGAAVLGPEGGEVTATLQMAMLGNLPYTALRDAVISHPTLAESLNNLFMTLDKAVAAE